MPVCRRLPEKDDACRVVDYGTCILRLQDILDVLCNGCRNASPFSRTLVDVSDIGRCRFACREVMELVKEDPCSLVLLEVLDHLVPDVIEADMKTCRLESADASDIEHDKSPVHADVRRL